MKKRLQSTNVSRMLEDRILKMTYKSSMRKMSIKIYDLIRDGYSTLNEES
jgi:hypothetical protein